jgi:hypothetical protein
MSNYMASYPSFSELIFLKLCEGMGSILLVGSNTSKKLWNLSDCWYTPSSISTDFPRCVRLFDCASGGNAHDASLFRIVRVFVYHFSIIGYEVFVEPAFR